MCTLAAPVKPIKIRIIGDIDKKLGATALRLPRVCHTEGAGTICDALMRLTDLVWNISTLISLIDSSIASLKLGVPLWTTSTRATRFWVTGMWASKLVHKTRYDTMKVDAVVKPRVGEVDKVSDRNGHHIIKELGPERPHGSVKSGNFGHCVL